MAKDNLTRYTPKGLKFIGCIDVQAEMTAAGRAAEYSLLLEIDKTMSLPIIPLFEIKNPLDNRICCPYARQGDAAAAATCEWATDAERTGCKLGDGRPCLFDEPNDSPMWQWVREQAAHDEARRKRRQGTQAGPL